MASLEAKGFGKPDEVRPFAAHGKAEVVKLGDMAVLRGTFEPGWKWSADVKPIAGTASCQAAHAGYVLSGRMKIVADDGKEAEVAPGDVFTIPPGHDAWTVGSEACVMIDFGASVGQYAKPS
jgi:uncharacterized cupin superfamily protein